MFPCAREDLKCVSVCVMSLCISLCLLERERGREGVWERGKGEDGVWEKGV